MGKRTGSVSKLFRAYRLYNMLRVILLYRLLVFQSSFELTGYITNQGDVNMNVTLEVSKLFRAYRLYNVNTFDDYAGHVAVSKLFRAYRLYNNSGISYASSTRRFQSSFELTGYITSSGSSV